MTELQNSQHFYKRSLPYPPFNPIPVEFFHPSLLFLFLSCFDSENASVSNSGSMHFLHGVVNIVFFRGLKRLVRTGHHFGSQSSRDVEVIVV